MEICLHIWDISSIEKFNNEIHKWYYNNVVGAFVVFDVNRNCTLEGAIQWKKRD